MITNNPSADLATLINVFTVEPARQQELVDVLTRATDETIRHMPGFVSAVVHKSIDGVRVTSQVQWRSRDNLNAMLRSPAAQMHLKEATALASTVDLHSYDMVAARAEHPIRRPVALPAAATGALALGVCAIGALAVGTIAVGSLAIGALSVKRAALRKLAVEDVTIGRLAVRQLVVERQ